MDSFAYTAMLAALFRNKINRRIAVYKTHFKLSTMKKSLTYLCAGVFLLLCAGCGASPFTDNSDALVSAKKDFFAMDTYMSLTAYGERAEEALSLAENATNELERLISTTDENSEVYKANSGGAAIALSTQTADIISAALVLCERTNGVLDITLYPVVAEWGFTRDVYHVPDGNKLDALLQNVDYRKVSIEDNKLCLPTGFMIDLGAIAKGYIADTVTDIMTEHGVFSAILDFGGDIRVIGSKPDGSPWRIAIQNPLQSNQFLGVLGVRDRAVVTSGGYERFFEQDGEAYWHIIDGATGAPAKSGLISVTVVGETGTLCDGLSTALFVMGAEKALEHQSIHGDFEMVLVTDQNEVIVTAGLKNGFTLTDTKNYRLVAAE